MERIQTAIEKARAQRERDDFSRAPSQDISARADASVIEARTVKPAAMSSQGAAPTHSCEDAWSALAPFFPSPDHLVSQRILTLQGGRGSILFDQLRTKVLQTMRSNNWKRLAITSPSEGCGKSTVAVNLAFSFARQPDLRTIQLEMDLRRPTLARLLGQQPEQGIVPWLEGTISFAEQAMCYNSNLAFALCQKPRADASDLLLQSRIGLVLEQMEQDYSPDLMIFDMPPVQANDDMMAFAGLVDCVLIVAGAEQSTVKQIDACERELAQQTNVMGVVLNKCEFMDPDAGYGAYYYDS